jgi:hypothetical protein
MFNDVRSEWRINDIERELRNKVDRYERTEADRNVDRLEHSLRELSSVVDGLRYELEACKNELNEIKQGKT